MKIHNLIIITLILLALILISCDEMDKGSLINEVENALASQNINPDYSYQAAIAPWLSDELTYIGFNTSNHIVNLFAKDQIISGNRIYFSVSSPTSTGDKIYAYISLETGEKHYLCPDPLCNHSENSGCKYAGIDNLTVDPDNDNKLYATKNQFTDSGMRSVLCEIDIANNKIIEIFNEPLDDPNIAYNRLELLFVSGEKIYFTDKHVYKEKVENGVSKKEQVLYLKSLTVGENKADTIASGIDSGIQCLCEMGEKLLCVDQINGRLFVTDTNYTNERTLLEFESGENIYDIYFDKSSNDIWLLVSSYSLHNATNIDISTEESKMYIINNFETVNQIDMPSNQILNFQLTEDAVYYTIYDPQEYGVSPRGVKTIDETGGKIYKVGRETNSSTEIIFDGRDELFFCGGFMAVGDYIYFDFYNLVNDRNMAYFKRMGSTVRINTKESTIHWMNFD